MQPHVLQPAHRAHRHVMALAAQDAADDQDHLGVAFDAPGAAHRLDAFARDIRGIELLEVDAARHHRDPLPRRAVAVVDQLGDLLAHRDDAVAARHDAVVQVLEDVLFAKALVPAGHERNAAQPRGDKGAPGAGAAERMDRVALPLAREPDQNGGVAQHHDRIVAGHIERDEFTAGRGHVGDQPAGARHHDGAVARVAENAHQLDRAGIGGAAIEAWARQSAR